MVTSGGRAMLSAASASRCSEICALDRPICMIGTLDALKLRICGGVIPAGICFRMVWEMAVTCAFAVLMFAPGWKKILTIP